MIYINEFEFYESEGCILAIPFDREGGTFGKDLDDAVASAADWLHETVKYALIHGESPHSGTFGHSPKHGGMVIAVSIDCDLNHVDAVTAADAARALGVSSARVAKMCESGILTSWRSGARRMILRESLEARIAETPKPGRPRKTATA